MHHSVHALFLSHQSAKSVPKTFFPHCLRSQIIIPRSLPTNPTFSLRNNGEEDPEDFGLLSGSKKLKGSRHGSQALRTEEGQVEKRSFRGCTTTIEEEGFGLLSCLFSHFSTPMKHSKWLLLAIAGNGRL
ncbi:hypothetical protein MRB53_033804 [Persea americana]|uniref:Uncharacterized protein n=1 Tax=Persea americana TaxID=3435 RepID=A0ACC2KWY2_PERAE|nr:hypothetical protein MRB53_033804 [Persea americana]